MVSVVETGAVMVSVVRTGSVVVGTGVVMVSVVVDLLVALLDPRVRY